MTSISSNDESRTEHVNNIVSPGMYFAFKEDYKIEDVSSMQVRDGHPEWADKGTVLMVSDVDYIDEKPHTILLKPHPDWMAYYRNYKKQVIRMLVADFARYMEFSENAEQIRDKERGNAEQRIKDIQETMRRLQEDPTEMSHRYLKAQQEEGKTMPAVIMPGRFTNSISEAIQTGEVEEFQRRVQAGANMIQFAATTMAEVAGELGEAVNALTPYYQERASLALAQIKGSVDQANLIMEGVKTLDLWVGNEVVVTPVLKGVSALKSEPLHVYQQVLFIAPELAYFENIDVKFGAYNITTFMEALKAHPALLKSIIPAQRGVVALATRKDEVDYGDTFTNAQMAIANKERTLLVRDGENVYLVDSPLWPHKMLPRLFPSQQQIDAIYAKNGKTITFRDLSYTDAVGQQARIALIYKRLMVMLGGLQARTQIFGDFCSMKEAIGFVSQDFQDKYMRFIRDDDGLGMLPKVPLTPLRDYLISINKPSTSGSTIFYDGYDCVNPRNAPSAFVSWGRGSDIHYDMRKEPEGGYKTTVAVLHNGKMAIKVPTRHAYTYNPSNVTAYLGRELSGYVGDNRPRLGWINLDAALPEELRLYIEDRNSRNESWTDFLRMFQEAESILIQKDEDEKEASQYWRDTAPNLSADNFRQVLRAWRISHPGEALTVSPSKSMKAFKKLLDCATANSDASRIVEAFELATGNSICSIEMNGLGEISIFAEKLEGEKNNLLHQDVTVWRYGEHDASKESVRLERHHKDIVDLYVNEARYQAQLARQNRVGFSEVAKERLLSIGAAADRFNWALDLVYEISKGPVHEHGLGMQLFNAFQQQNPDAVERTLRSRGFMNDEYRMALPLGVLVSSDEAEKDRRYGKKLSLIALYFEKRKPVSNHCQLKIVSVAPRDFDFRQAPDGNAELIAVDQQEHVFGGIDFDIDQSGKQVLDQAFMLETIQDYATHSKETFVSLAELKAMILELDSQRNIKPNAEQQATRSALPKM